MAPGVVTEQPGHRERVAADERDGRRAPSAGIELVVHHLADGEAHGVFLSDLVLGAGRR